MPAGAAIFQARPANRNPSDYGGVPVASKLWGGKSASEFRPRARRHGVGRLEAMHTGGVEPVDLMKSISDTIDAGAPVPAEATKELVMHKPNA